MTDPIPREELLELGRRATEAKQAREQPSRHRMLETTDWRFIGFASPERILQLVAELLSARATLAQIAAYPCARVRTGQTCRESGLVRGCWCPSCLAREGMD